MPYRLDLVIALFVCAALAAFCVLSFKSYRWALKNHKTAAKSQLLQSRKALLIYNTLLLVSLALLDFLSGVSPGQTLDFRLFPAALLRIGIRHAPILILLNYFVLGMWARQAEDRASEKPPQALTLPGWVLLILILPSVIRMIALSLALILPFIAS